ncbi:hypothetical protein M8818_005683 [Zalaria obscura]|uniref:Uncharacterized protein n=1 Tax=Zalaria obscura TaxID=2024903 RepID=A0ACC3SAH0_9PEZI
MLRRPVSWIGRLFAVLACGIQFSDSTLPERRKRSSNYVRYAFQCLRIANFLVRPTLLCVETLMILGNVLENDMKPESAWMLLGTTVRMAQSLGLHEERSHDSPRRKLWYTRMPSMLALVRQDSLLCMCYDRPPVTVSSRVERPEIPLSGTIPFREAMDYLVDIFTRSGKVAWLCRPALHNRHSSELRESIQQELIETCNRNLLECVRAFVNLLSLSTFASRSWVVIHNGLSSALLLGFLGETLRNPEVRLLQGEIVEIFSKESQDDGVQERDSDSGIDLSRAHLRAVAALRRICSSQGNHTDQVPPTNNESSNHEIAANETHSSERFGEPWPTTTNEGDPMLMNMENLLAQSSSGIDMNPLDMVDSIIWGTHDNYKLAKGYWLIEISDPMTFGDTESQAAQTMIPDFNFPWLEPAMF